MSISPEVGRWDAHGIRALLVLGTLAGCSGGQSPSGETADRGGRLYGGNCVACHQADGRGIAGVYPSLAGSKAVLGDAGALARWVVEGRRPADWAAGRYATQMPKFGWLKPRDAAALFTYLRSNFGNSAPPVDAAAVESALGVER